MNEIYISKSWCEDVSWSYLFYVDGRMAWSNENANIAWLETRITSYGYKTREEALKAGLKHMAQYYELTTIKECNDWTFQNGATVFYPCDTDEFNKIVSNIIKSEVKPKPVSDEDIEQYCKALIKRREELEKEWQCLKETKHQNNNNEYKNSDDVDIFA